MEKQKLIEMIEEMGKSANDKFGAYITEANEVPKKVIIEVLTELAEEITEALEKNCTGYSVTMWNKDTINPANIERVPAEAFKEYANNDIIKHITKKLWVTNVYNKVHNLVDYAIHYLIKDMHENEEISDEMKNNHEAIMAHFKNIYAKRFKLTIEEMYFYRTMLRNMSNEYQEMIYSVDEHIKALLSEEWEALIKVQEYLDSIIYTLRDEDAVEIEQSLMQSKYSKLYEEEKAIYAIILKQFRKEWDLENEEFEKELAQFIAE